MTSMVYILFSLVVTVLLAIAGEQAIIGILNTSDITGLMRIVLLAVLPGSLITAWITLALRFAR